jgi:hypothetical protein
MRSKGIYRTAAQPRLSERGGGRGEGGEREREGNKTAAGKAKQIRSEHSKE